MNTSNEENSDHESRKHKHGPTSFWMQDPKIVFSELRLEKGDCFIDVGCGTGDYAFAAAELVGATGKVYAFDIRPEVVAGLQERIAASGSNIIETKVSDVTEPLPLDDNCANVCFMATVLHAIDLGKHGQTVFREARRVLKPGGCLAVVECKKEEMPFGPPMEMRLSPEEIEKPVARYGFEKISLIDLGYNYLIQFKVK
ncbi:MAG: class I SAM-dependent methyltransferase [Candidatus Glassbacteria bacterium]|nr:class I SAM-dependent methyltransferase [Candidatus Glassbacteria bacterium]